MTTQNKNQPFVFFGSPRFAEIILSDLIGAGFVPSLVICSPDKPVGRKQIITSPPVKVVAQKWSIPILQPSKKPCATDIAEMCAGTSFAVVAAYAHIIPPETLALFPKGVLGIHPSLLPLYRGPSPIQSSLLDGAPITGVSLYRVDAEMDHGPIIHQETTEIDETDNYYSLEEKLAHIGSQMCISKIPEFLEDVIVPQEQDHERATYTKKFKTEDGFVDLEKDSILSIVKKIRALAHDPGVFTIIDGKRIKLREIQKIEGTWAITKIIPEGKSEREAMIILK